MRSQQSELSTKKNVNVNSNHALYRLLVQKITKLIMQIAGISVEIAVASQVCHHQFHRHRLSHHQYHRHRFSHHQYHL
jgi:thymidylate synthase ThyX